MYDAALARFHATDPVAGVAPNWTPYRYAFNNPLRYIDPNGMYESAADKMWNNHIEQFNTAFSRWGEVKNEEDNDLITPEKKKNGKTEENIT